MAIRVSGGGRGVGRQVGRQMGRWVDRQVGRQVESLATHSGTDKQTHRHTDKQTIPKSATPIPNVPMDSNTPLGRTLTLIYIYIYIFVRELYNYMFKILLYYSLYNIYHGFSKRPILTKACR